MKSRSYLALILSIYYCGAACSFAASPATEASKKPPALILSPIPLKDKEMPAPGHPMTLKVKIPRTKDIGLNVHALVVRDGKLSDIASIKSYMNDFDEAVYEFSIPAPLAELSYRFMLRNSDGSGYITQRISKRRDCIPQVVLTQVETDRKPSRDMEKELIRLVKLAKGLERDVAVYERAVVLLEEIRKVFKDE